MEQRARALEEERIRAAWERHNQERRRLAEERYDQERRQRYLRDRYRIVQVHHAGRHDLAGRGDAVINDAVRDRELEQERQRWANMRRQGGHRRRRTLIVEDIIYDDEEDDRRWFRGRGR